ncbi:uncharacterized protein [Amphiura filiformis]|uniref:uncharacterized protein isoform X2 n=1 Tax=Amphiura filiformis TaxID=82378 RepID=UPI003B2104DA
METLDSSDTGRIVSQERGHGGSGVNIKLLLMLVVVAILLASVALVVALISLTQNGHGGGEARVTITGQEGSDSKQDKIWNIATGHMTSNNIYIDQPSGQLKGFNVDLINAGWIKGHTRARTFQFSKPWQKPVNYHFIVQTGNPRGFNPTDVTNVTFGFVDGFINDEFCLARQTSITGSTLSTSQIQHYPQPTDMFNAVLSGEVDVCIAVGNNLPTGLTRLEDPAMDCPLDASGGGLMLRMDNPLLEWWDPALERLIQTSEYHEICQDIIEEHGHMPGRDPKDRCFGY